MKNKKICTFIIGAALLANLGVVSLASATATTSDAVVSGGSLTIVTVPATTNFPTVPTSLTSTTTGVTFTANSVEISDLRGNPATFTFAVASSDFNNTGTQSTNTFDLSALSLKSDNDSLLTAVSSSDCTTGITITNSSLTAFSGTDVGTPGEVSTAMTVISGDGRARVIDCQMEPVLQVIVPARQNADTYRTTLTWTIS